MDRLALRCAKANSWHTFCSRDGWKDHGEILHEGSRPGVPCTPWLSAAAVLKFLGARDSMDAV